MGFFDRLLRGKRPQSTAEIDRLVVRQLVARGADLSQPRHVMHFIYCAQESNAHDAAKAIDAAGYDVKVVPPSDDIEEWTVRAEAYRIVGFETVQGFRAWFEQIAAEHDGEYDGWEPAVKP
jgi:Regulator of ribonuclease activity B